MHFFILCLAEVGHHFQNRYARLFSTKSSVCNIEILRLLPGPVITNVCVKIEGF